MFWIFGFQTFGFVEDFVIRISDLALALGRAEIFGATNMTDRACLELPDRWRQTCALLCGLVSFSCMCVGHAHAQLRIVNYNTLGKPVNSQDEAEFETIMEAIDQA